MKRTVEFVRGWFLDICCDENGIKWRAELWHNPYDGTLVATTRWAPSRRQAQADAKRFLRVPRLRMPDLRPPQETAREGK